MPVHWASIMIRTLAYAIGCSSTAVYRLTDGADSTEHFLNSLQFAITLIK